MCCLSAANYVEKIIGVENSVIRRVYNNGIGPNHFLYHGQAVGEKYTDSQVVSFELFARPTALPEVVRLLNQDKEVLRWNVLRKNSCFGHKPVKKTQNKETNTTADTATSTATATG